MNAVIYARYSSASQDEQTIEVQLNACMEYAKQHNLVIIKEYIDEAKSGRSDNRPAFKEMLNDSEIENFDFVIVYKLDRFARNLRLSVNSEETLKKRGIITLSTVEPNSDDAQGKLIRGMNYLLAEFYSNDYGQRIKKGLENVSAKFQATGGQRTLGYRTADKKYIIDETESIAIKKVFEMYSMGSKEKEIIDYLNSQGFKTAKNGAFNKNSLNHILKNKRYKGIYVFKDMEVPNQIPKIISDELFDEVQERMNKNKKAPARARAKEEYLLTTKLFCGHCKEMMVGVSGTSRNGNIHNYYACKNAKIKQCNKKTVQKKYIEDLIVNEARNLLTDDNIKNIAKNAIELYEKEKDNLGINKLKRDIKEIERKKNNLIKTLSDIDDDSIRNSLIPQIKDYESQLKIRITELTKEESKRMPITEPRIVYFLTKLKDGDVNDIQYRRTLINIFINRLYLYDKKAIISFNTQDKEVDIDLETLKDMENVLINNDILHHIVYYPYYVRVFL